jgi:hypothetical protein
MLSIEEIKLTIDTLKKLKKEDFEKFITEYLDKLEGLASKVDAYNSNQIRQLDKTTSWFQADLDWREAHSKDVFDPLLSKLIESKIFQFAKHGDGKYNCLEIGPGYGKYSKFLLAWRIIFFLEALPQVKPRLFKKFQPQHHKHLRFYTTDRTACPDIPDHSCNFVFSWDLFPFLSYNHIERYLRDINRVMLPGGYGFINYANCEYEKPLYEAKRGYWNYNTKSKMAYLLKNNGYEVIEMDQFRPGADYVIFKKPGKMNPVVYSTLEIPVEK